MALGVVVGTSATPLKKRRKRTNLDLTQRAALDTYFALNPRPDHAKMAQIAESLELDRDVCFAFSFIHMKQYEWCMGRPHSSAVKVKTVFKPKQIR